MLDRAVINKSLAWLVTLGLLTGCATGPKSAPPPPPIYFLEWAFGVTAMSPDSRQVAVANTQAIVLLDTDTLNTIRVFGDNPKCDSNYDWVPRYGLDNSLHFVGREMIASTGMFGDITIWDVNDDCPADVLFVPELEALPISFAWSAATGQIAVGGENGKVVLLDPNQQGGYTHRVVGSLDGAVYDLLFSRDGSYLAAAGAHPEVLIWSASTLEKAGSLPVKGVVRNMQLVAEKRTLLVAADELVLWKFLSEEEASNLENPSMTGQKVAEAGLIALAIVMTAGSAMAGAGYTGPGLDAGAVPGVGYMTCDRMAIMSPDARLLVDRHPGVVKETIRVIDVETNEVIEKLNPYSKYSCDMAFTPDGTKLLVASMNGVTLYETATWKRKKKKIKLKKHCPGFTGKCKVKFQ